MSRNTELAYITLKAISAYDRLVKLTGSEAAANAEMANARLVLQRPGCCSGLHSRAEVAADKLKYGIASEASK